MSEKRSIPDLLAESAILFLLFGFIGWVYEVVLAIHYGYGFINRGFLFGPYLPLYGFGALLLIACLSRLMGCNIRMYGLTVTPVVVFLLIMLITTVVEYIVGWGLEVIFHQRWWDYSTYNFNLHGRVCLSASLRFGIGGMAFLYILTPVFRRVISRIPPRARRIAACVIVGVLVVDFVVTLVYASAHGFNPELAQAR